MKSGLIPSVAVAVLFCLLAWSYAELAVPVNPEEPPRFSKSWKTAAEIAADHAKQVDEARERAKSPKGTIVRVSEGATLLENSIADTFSQADIVPPERLREFDWVDSEFVEMEIIGWTGRILTARTADGVTTFTVRLHPHLIGGSPVMWTTQYVDETWEYTDGKFTFVRLKSNGIAIVYGE